MLSNLKKAGASDDIINALEKELVQQQPVLLKENVEAFQWFLDVQSFLTMSGLDMTQVQADAVLSERKTNPVDYKKLKKLGIEAALYLSESKKR